ncbi:MAG: hypothetical protein ACK5MQ_02760 [Pikeienuella sp.]
MEEEIERIQRLFGGEAFKFARWGCPIAPTVIGLDDAGTRLFAEAVKLVAGVASAEIEDIDPEMGANFLIYVMQDWAHASRAPNLPNFLPDLPALIERLTEADANRYRVFAFDDQGAIRAAITLLRYDEKMRAAPVDYIALTEAALGVLVYDEAGISADRPVIMAGIGEDAPRAALDPWHARLIRAAYDPTIPAGAKDPSLAMRLAARIGVMEDAGDDS